MKLTDLPDEISPFPDAGNLLYGHRTSPKIEFGSQFPLQKLRPIRSNGGDLADYPDSPANFGSGELPENGSLAGNLLYGHRMAVTASPNIELRSQVMPLQIKGRDGDSMEWCDSPANVYDEALPEKGGGAGNRWPQAETLTLLKIRSEMDAQFRDANPKGPLWEIVSRKLEQLGYHRDSKKCKEKFKNIYKYYKRSKERLVRVSPYKFFSELVALDNQNNGNSIAETGLSDNTRIATPDTVEIPNQLVSFQTSSTDFLSEFSSDDDELNEDIEEPVNQKRKRETGKKFEIFLENLMKKVMKKQEEMHKQLMEIIEKREKDRIIREEAWKQQEMERVKRDKEMRAQETSRSLALISFIGNVLGQQIHIPQSPEPPYPDKDHEEKHDQTEYKFDSSNQRWPKSEVQALITLRTTMEHKFRSVEKKGPVWEEISLAMSSLGYSRSAKKCKEKWENINKYFKRAMVCGKKRPENTKTCPYFRELNILYRNGLINLGNTPNETNEVGDDNCLSMPKTLKPVKVHSDSSPEFDNVIHSSNI